MVRCDVTGRITLGTKLKCPFSPFTYLITCKVGFWYFEGLRDKNTVSNKTYQYFRYRRLVRPGSKSPNWQGSQPISCNEKYSCRDNIYLVDLRSKITYQNIRGELKSERFLYHKMPKMTKKVTLELTWMTFLQNVEVCFNQERLTITYQNLRRKSLVRLKTKFPNWQGAQPISYKATFSQKESMYLIDFKLNINYQNNQGKIQFRPHLKL